MDKQSNGAGGAGLPVEEALPALREALAAGSAAVLIAPPGAGKTTRVPLALLDEPWVQGRKLLMLEPRRLAARSAARYMAGQRGEPVGRTVGYRVRMDTRVGPETRIEVITEGVLTRMLQEDPALEGVAGVVFDEFHERSLHADVGLALCMQAQTLLREDLRLVVMSATLEAEPVAGLLGGAPVVVSEGRMFPVETRHLGRRPEPRRLEEAVTAGVLEALQAWEGDVLVFLPGAGEIRRTETRLRQALGEAGRLQQVEVLPLYGTLPQEEQDRALAPAAGGLRKVVLATSIAETSLTVDGVRAVVDAGLSRVPRFSPRTGMTRLETVPVSRASADQRRGRAGRQGPGLCIRLWSEEEDRQLAARSTPELLEADLAPLALDLAVWGASPDELQWLDAPPAAAMKQARELLTRLGALDAADGSLTLHGRAMAALPLHPRLAHMALRAVPLGLGELACDMAALLSERDVLRGAGGAGANADLRLRVEALRRAGGEAAALGLAADPAALARVRAEAAHWRRELAAVGACFAAPDAAGVTAVPPSGASVPRPGAPTALGRASGSPPAAVPSSDACGLLLAFAYPDRIGQLRSAGRFTLQNGRGAVVAEGQPLAYAPYLVAAELDDTGADSRVYLAAPVELVQLEAHLADQLQLTQTVAWDRSTGSVRGRTRVTLGALILSDKPLAQPDPAAVQAALLEGIREEGLHILPWTKAASQLLERLRFMHRADPARWPDVSEEALLAELPAWLGPYTAGMKSRGDLARLHMADILLSRLDWSARQALERDAPTHLTVPSGSRIPVDYSDPAAPVLSVRLQEVFGWSETPRIGGGRVPVLMHLLSPAQRPVQVTRDLANFWRETYFDVKKDLKGRYPKHYWPDDPLEATATSRVRPKPKPNGG